MKKNLRKIPDFVLQRLNEIEQQEIVVCVVLKIKENEIHDEKYRNLDLEIINNELHFKGEFIPDRRRGCYSRKNLDGYKIFYPDLPKVSKTYYLGERPIYGDYRRGTFPMYMTRDVRQYDFISPKELAISTELINETIENGQKIFTLKVQVDQVLLKDDRNFNRDLLFALNLLQENVYSVNIYAADADVEAYIRSLEVNWEFFPPGERSQEFQRLIENIRNVTPELIQNIQDRETFLRELNPVGFVYGTSGMRRYFGARFSDRLVVFENIRYGNAIYILFENWQELSQRSRMELLLRPNDQYIRIPHYNGWREKSRDIIEARR